MASTPPTSANAAAHEGANGFKVATSSSHSMTPSETSAASRPAISFAIPSAAAAKTTKSSLPTPISLDARRPVISASAAASAGLPPRPAVASVRANGDLGLSSRSAPWAGPSRDRDRAERASPERRRRHSRSRSRERDDWDRRRDRDYDRSDRRDRDRERDRDSRDWRRERERSRDRDDRGRRHRDDRDRYDRYDRYSPSPDKGKSRDDRRDRDIRRDDRDRDRDRDSDDRRRYDRDNDYRPRRTSPSRRSPQRPSRLASPPKEVPPPPPEHAPPPPPSSPPPTPVPPSGPRSSKPFIKTGSIPPPPDTRPPSPPADPPPAPPVYNVPACVRRRPGAGNFLYIADPAQPQNPKAQIKRLDGVHNGVEAKGFDPRLKMPQEVRERGHGSMKHRPALQDIVYEWDDNSPGPKPPDPPQAILLTGLNPLTTVDQITKFLRPHGKIKEIDAKMDPKSGMQLGVCWVKFEGPLAGRPGTPHDVAMHVVRVLSGQRVGLRGDERVKIVLDGRGVLATKAAKEEMDRRYKPKPKVEPKVEKVEPPKVEKPPPSGPRANRPPPRPPVKFDTFGRNFASLNRSLPVRGFQPMPPRPGFRGMQDFSRDFHAAEVSRSPRGPFGHRAADLYSPSSGSGSRSRSRSVSSESSDSDDESPMIRARGPARAALDKKEADEAAAEKVKTALTTNGHAYVFIDAKSLPYGQVREEHVHDHFRAFKPESVLHSAAGWYILFSDSQAAHRAQPLLNKTAVLGHRVALEVKSSGAGEVAAAGPEKGGWRFLTITKKRPTMRPPPSPKRVKQRRRHSLSYTSSESEDEVVRKPKVERDVKPVVPEVVDKVEPVAATPKKRPAKQPTTKAKKARIESPVEPAVVEIKVVKPKRVSPLDALVSAGSLVDDEDAYWLKQALAGEADLSDGEPELDEEHPLYHTSGAWRAEGWKKVQPIQKSSYLPQRNRAQTSVEESAGHSVTTGRTARITGRRLAIDMETSRKAAAPTGAAAAAESDVFAFNQLRIRKKQLRFARSAIEGYGLYAMETIQTGEMVCEYVGELCRSAVAEIREQQYMKQGIGSSYLFRIDGDVVCDATFKGSTSRLINHSCDPTASAKIISINRQSKIVIYAKKVLHPGEEVTYDYRFPIESDPALRVVCLCGSEKCNGYLN